jgi:hypothetical protein
MSAGTSFALANATELSMSVAVCKTADEVRALARSRFVRPNVPVVRVARPAPEPQPDPKPIMRVPTLEEAERVVFIVPEEQRHIRAHDKASEIIEQCAIKYGVSRQAMRSTSRRASLVRARHEAMYRMRMELKNFSYPLIARRLGIKDHTSAYYGASKHAALNDLPLDGLSHRSIRRRFPHLIVSNRDWLQL